MGILPKERIWLALILIIALVYPIHHALFYFFPPEEYIFNGGHGDEGTALALMESVEHQYRDPWSLEGKTFFSNPTIPSAFILIPFGFISFLLKLDYALFFIFLKFIFSFAYLLVLYHLTKYFTRTKKEFNIAFLILMLTSGIGATLQIPTAVITNDYTFAGIFPSTYGLSIDDSGFTILSQFQHLYRLVALFAGYAALYFFIIKRNVYSSLFLGLSILAHPFLGSTIVFFILIYTVLNRNVSDFIPIFLVSALFLIPWAVIYVEDPSVSQYLYKEKAFLPAILISGGLPLLFAYYFLHTRISRKIVSIALVISSIALSLAQLSLLNLPYFTLRLDTWMYIMLHIPFFAIVAFISVMLGRMKDKNYLFLFLIFLAAFSFSLWPFYAPWFPIRFLNFLWFPVAILATRGLLLFAERYRINVKKLLVVVFALSLPWLIVFNLNFQLHARDVKYPDFFHKDEVEALDFLKLQPPGIVLSSGVIGSYIPYRTGQKAFIGGTIKGEEGRKEDYKIFFSASDDEERQNILGKYGISYIFYGYNELEISNIDMENKEYLEKIYEKNVVKIFKVRS